MKKKWGLFNHGLTLVNGGRRQPFGRQEQGVPDAYFSTFSLTISMRVSLTLSISNS
jgi:hypothetical protein